MIQTVTDYIGTTYHTAPEYLWARTPNNAIFRHPVNRKWFAALLRDLPRKTLGLEGEGRVDVLNLKVDPLMRGSLLDGRTILPGYHMNKAHWVSVLLDGSAGMDTLGPLIDLSYGIIHRGKSGPPA